MRGETMLDEPVTGVFLVGEYMGVRPVHYGNAYKDESKRGLPVPGMFEVGVKVGTFEQRASYFDVDSWSQQPTLLATQLLDGQFQQGERVAVRVRPRTAAGSEYTNWDGLAIFRPAALVAAAESAGNGKLRTAG